MTTARPAGRARHVRPASLGPCAVAAARGLDAERRTLLQRLACTAAALALPAVTVGAQPLPASLSIELQPTGDLGALLTVRVALAGREVLAVVDTGATAHLVDPAIGAALQLPADGQVNVDLPGGRQRVRWLRLDGLKLGDADAGAQRALELDLGTLREATGVDVRMLLGMPLWASRPTSFDLEHLQLRWGDDPPVGADRHDWPLQLDGGLPTVAARFGSRLDGQWLLDTGNAGAAVVFARRVDSLALGASPALPSLTMTELGGDVSVRFARSALGRIGAGEGYTRRDVPVALESGRAARRSGHFDRLAGSLGSAMFDGGTLWLDVGGRRAVLRHPGGGSALPGGFGLVPALRDGALAVRQVFPDSPAALAGLQPGERLVTVDGLPLASPTALWRAVRGRASTTLVVESGGRSRSVTLQRAAFFPLLD